MQNRGEEPRENPGRASCGHWGRVACERRREKESRAVGRATGSTRELEVSAVDELRVSAVRSSWEFLGRGRAVGLGREVELGVYSVPRECEPCVCG
ncbi:hypothetical protein CDL15_Pgr026441 [Punica granatum]|uniref:Uncharacterized protein n=1 Tax=Punica granatum TaxID=22663 RepID=A0A218XHL9_PUNGR|nr:hypothetical protein CDL15_Pgr026441 [Punica granatum]